MQWKNFILISNLKKKWICISFFFFFHFNVFTFHCMPGHLHLLAPPNWYFGKRLWCRTSCNEYSFVHLSAVWSCHLPRSTQTRKHQLGRNAPPDHHKLPNSHRLVFDRLLTLNVLVDHLYWFNQIERSEESQTEIHTYSYVFEYTITLYYLPSWFVPVKATDDNKSNVIFPSGFGYSIGLHSAIGFNRL